MLHEGSSSRRVCSIMVCTVRLDSSLVCIVGVGCLGVDPVKTQTRGGGGCQFGKSWTRGESAGPRGAKTYFDWSKFSIQSVSCNHISKLSNCLLDVENSMTMWYYYFRALFVVCGSLWDPHIQPGGKVDDIQISSLYRQCPSMAVQVTSGQYSSEVVQSLDLTKFLLWY